jgi:hypothetical protein
MSWLRLIEQRIKEMEKKPPAAAHAPRKKNRMLHLVSEMWPAYLIEIVVIILGISITLVLEEWRDSDKEEKLENVYLANLSADIDADLQSLNYASSNTKTLIRQGEEIVQFVKNPVLHPLSAGELCFNVRAILGRPNFIAHDATFSDLKSSGNLHLVKDISLKTLLFAYYTHAQNVKEHQDAEQQATILLTGGYFLKWFPLDELDSSPSSADTVVFKNLPKNIEFRNNVLLRVVNRKELLADYEGADSLALQLRAALLKKGS